MSRFLEYDGKNFRVIMGNRDECRYKTNRICFNNMCKWYGKKCHYEDKCEGREAED